MLSNEFAQRSRLKASFEDVATCKTPKVDMGRDARGYVGPRWPEAALFVGVPVFIFHGKVTSRAACRMQIKSSSSSSKKQHEMKFLARYLFESEQTALGRKVHRPKTGVGRKVLFKQHTSASLIKSFPPISTSKNGSFSHHPGVALTSHCAKKDKSASDLRKSHKSTPKLPPTPLQSIIISSFHLPPLSLPMHSQ